MVPRCRRDAGPARAVQRDGVCGQSLPGVGAGGGFGGLLRQVRPDAPRRRSRLVFSAYPPGRFDVVWASPPCTQYSTARTRGPPRDLEGADRLVAKALEIIDYFGPRWWWMENPATGLLKTRPVVQPLGRPYLVSYCHYGFPYRKHTALWSNNPHLEARVCRKDCPHYDAATGRHPVSAQRGGNKYERRPQLALETLYRIPQALCADIAEASCAEAAGEA